MSANLNSSLEALFSKMENFVTTKTVVGDPIHIGDVIIVPLVDVVFGVGAGAGSGNDDKKDSGGGGGGLGAKISPTAVLVVVNGSVQLVSVKNQDSVNKLIDMVPGILSKLNFGPFSNKRKESAESAATFEETTVVEDM